MVKGFIAPPMKMSSEVRPATSSRRLAAMSPSGRDFARLADRCHPYEAVSLTAADCHRYAHANNTAMCVAREPECLAACPTLSDAGVGDAGSTDGALPPSQCAQLGSICHDSTTALGMACHDFGHPGDLRGPIRRVRRGVLAPGRRGGLSATRRRPRGR